MYCTTSGRSKRSYHKNTPCRQKTGCIWYLELLPRVASAAVVTATAVTAEITAWRTSLLRASFIDHDSAAIHLAVVQLVDSSFCCIVIVKFDETEAFGAVGFAVDDDLS